MDALEEREGALEPPQSRVPFALVPAPGAPPIGPVLLEELAGNADHVWHPDEGPQASPGLISNEYPA